ncbi:hypothetical protein [Actinomycetospora sp. NBRC 106375]|nr:hypothetical protein [Actinomycetospora sp. NBRC 106375]
MTPVLALVPLVRRRHVDHARTGAQRCRVSSTRPDPFLIEENP